LETVREMGDMAAADGVGVMTKEEGELGSEVM
jgi:hypothetical protein